MRTNILTDDELIHQAMRASGLSIKEAAVEVGLHLLIQVKGQASVRRLRAEVRWQGDLAKMRSSRTRPG